MSKPLVKSVVTADFSTGHRMGGDDEEDENKVMKSSQAGKSSSSCKVVVRCCQADKCGADMAVGKQYHTRHKVCEVHAKAQSVLVAGMRQRFCQQCSRFHEVSEFDESKRSCRRRLAGHNERRRRRRKSDPNQAKAGMVCGRFNYSLPEKHFHIR